jgi:hypothetical protein
MAPSPQPEREHWSIVLVVVERDGDLVLVVEPTQSAVVCPNCGVPSRRQDSRYERHPLVLPWRGKTVRMRVHSRRWFCDTPSCSRRIFAERFDGALAHYARRTDGTTDLLTTFALQAGGEGGARLARKAGVPISPDTLLREPTRAREDLRGWLPPNSGQPSCRLQFWRSTVVGAGGAG